MWKSKPNACSTSTSSNLNMGIFSMFIMKSVTNYIGGTLLALCMVSTAHAALVTYNFTGGSDDKHSVSHAPVDGDVNVQVSYDDLIARWAQ